MLQLFLPEMYTMQTIFLKMMEKITLSEICKKCAECCKNYPFVTLSTNEIHSLEQLTGLPSEVFTIPKRKVIEEFFLQFQQNGFCFFLKENKGFFSCSVYNARPKICKKYPSNLLQQEVCAAANKEKFLSNVFG